MSAPEWHEKWCGVFCRHEDCGVCTCPRQQREVAHPHVAPDRRVRTCPDAYMHPYMLACARCAYRKKPEQRSEVACPRCGSSHSCSPFVSIWNTRTTSSGNFDRSNGRGVDTSHAKCGDTGWSEYERRLAWYLVVTLIFIAAVVYVGVRYWS